MRFDSILICAATVSEMNACLSGPGIDFNSLPMLEERTGPQARSQPWSRTWARTWRLNGQKMDLALTGVGIPLTLARLMPLLERVRPSLILNLGIAGAYLETGLKIGDLVVGESECFGDLGMETPEPDQDAFIPLARSPWADDIYKGPIALELGPWKSAGRVGELAFKQGRGCTVNACTGTKETGQLRRKTFACDFESMEGAAVALAGYEMQIPVAEIRGISNWAATRDMQPDNIQLALRNLGVYMHDWFRQRT